MDKINLTIKVSQFFLDLLNEAKEYQEGYEEGSLSLYIHIMSEMMVESRGAESFDTLGDTHAREQFSSAFEELAPHHSIDFKLEDRFLDEMIPLLGKYYKEIKHVSPEAIVHAFVKMCCVGGDFLTHIVPEEVIVAEMAEEYHLSPQRMRNIIDDFRASNNGFNVYKWRDDELVEQFEHFVDVEITRGLGG